LTLVAELRALLERLPDEARLVVNGVGNLAVLKPNGVEFAGFIDFRFPESSDLDDIAVKA
jgi:hypothetical protein